MDELRTLFDAIPGLSGVDPESLGGWLYAALGAMVFAENGLLVAGLLPGSSLVVAAGALAADGVLALSVLAPLFLVASTLADLSCYAVGVVAGQRLLARRGRWFGGAAVRRAVTLFERRGESTLLISRFLPVLVTVAPVLAGASRMPMGRFLAFSVAGKVIWTTSLLALGFAIGSLPGVEMGTGLMAAIVVGSIALAGMAEGARRLFTRRGMMPGGSPS